jgi:hypothetical protein
VARISPPRVALRMPVRDKTDGTTLMGWYRYVEAEYLWPTDESADVRTYGDSYAYHRRIHRLQYKGRTIAAVRVNPIERGEDYRSSHYAEAFQEYIP